MNFIIIYIISFFVCLFIGDVFYLKSDKGIFRSVGLIPIINTMVSIIMTIYFIYIAFDMFILDQFREFREKKGRYSKIRAFPF